MMKLKTYIPFALILLLPALLPEAAALRAQSLRNSFPKVSVGNIRYVDKALSGAIDRLASRISEYYNHRYPLHGCIVERGEEKKDKQRTVYIDLGTGCRVGKGQQFNIYALKTIAWREARQEIGRLKVEEVMDDDLSLCKVTKGEKEIKAALDQEQTLVVSSR